MANYPIQDSSGWLTILRKLGLTGVVRWVLSDTVVPVALVDSEVTLNASTSTPLVNVPASAGEVVAPAANSRLANTGALPAGAYSMVFWLSAPEVNRFRIRRRNAADTADVWSFLWWMAAGGDLQVGLRLLIAPNELVVVENVLVGTAGVPYQASIFVSAG